MWAVDEQRHSWYLPLIMYLSGAIELLWMWYLDFNFKG